jgi:hypothetical protein
VPFIRAYRLLEVGMGEKEIGAVCVDRKREVCERDTKVSRYSLKVACATLLNVVDYVCSRNVTTSCLIKSQEFDDYEW